jgi:uncharacterized membrane protein
LSNFFPQSLFIYLVAIDAGYGTQLITGILLLQNYFGSSDKGFYKFLPWLRKYRRLSAIGTALNFGLFSHMIFVWHSEIGVPVYGLFYAAPQYDIPALYAYLATLVTTIYFVTSAETKFYLKYEQYFNSLNFQGTISTVHEAREEMLTVLWSDAIHGAIIQFLFTVGMLSIGLILFERLQPGFTMQMKNYYIILSLAYGIYATANMLSLYSTYFADYRSVMIDTMVFAITSTVMCFLTSGSVRVNFMESVFSSAVFFSWS